MGDAKPVGRVQRVMKNMFGADGEYTVQEQGLPVIPDSYGTNSALSSGQGVPVWYGSAEHSQGYNDKMDESMGMRHRGKHSQSMKDRLPRRPDGMGMDSLQSHGPIYYQDVATGETKT